MGKREGKNFLSNFRSDTKFFACPNSRQNEIYTYCENDATIWESFYASCYLHNFPVTALGQAIACAVFFSCHPRCCFPSPSGREPAPDVIRGPG